MERKESIRLGDYAYYTGIPCKNGHLDYRYSKSGSCRTCTKHASSAYRKAKINELSKLRKSADHFTKDIFVETTWADYEILMLIAQTYVSRYKPEYEKLNLNTVEISTKRVFIAKFRIPRRNVNLFINIANFLRSMS